MRAGAPVGAGRRRPARRLLAGAVEVLRRRAGLRVYASMRKDHELAAAIRAAGGPARSAELFAAGGRLGRAEVLDLARDTLWAGAGRTRPGA